MRCSPLATPAPRGSSSRRRTRRSARSLPRHTRASCLGRPRPTAHRSSPARPTALPSPAPTGCQRWLFASPTSTGRTAITRARSSRRSASGARRESRSSSTATAPRRATSSSSKTSVAASRPPSSTGGNGVVAHLGSGVETTVLDVAGKVAERFGSTPFEHRPARVGDVPRSSADISTARQLFGFAPSTSLDDGLDRTVAWFRESDA